ncbi:hypothetical protein [Thermomonospora umbrina]|uniref:Uncharacterized protein n=1 Tax=Thermomonospora umbrina TaxID=111806 RepID=A0A3D9SNA3_9ACTN|nr:hypothetical protein [Thermomonospora umbrina]REE97426.1 hypothetical protein DFJ69_2897 [Thermomonospora umbrina]
MRLLVGVLVGTALVAGLLLAAVGSTAHEETPVSPAEPELCLPDVKLCMGG